MPSLGEFGANLRPQGFEALETLSPGRKDLYPIAAKALANYNVFSTPLINT